MFKIGYSWGFAMNRAYVVIKTELGCEKEVKESLLCLPEVKEVHEVHGVYDLVVRLEANKLSKIEQTVGEKVSSLDNVRSTLTMLEM